MTRVGTTYYVSSTTGKDSKTGLSPTEAWLTMAKVSSKVFVTGDVVHLYGTIVDRPMGNPGSGTASAPIVLVGDGPFDGRAKIDSIALTSAEHVVYMNLEASGAGKVLVATRPAGASAVRFVRFENLYLHDADYGGSVDGANGADIAFVNTVIRGTRMDGVLLSDTAGDRFSYVGGAIENTCGREYQAGWELQASTRPAGTGTCSTAWSSRRTRRARRSACAAAPPRSAIAGSTAAPRCSITRTRTRARRRI